MLYHICMARLTLVKRPVEADLLFVSTMPSHSAVTDVFNAPMSTTRAVALLCEYLRYVRQPG